MEAWLERQGIPVIESASRNLCLQFEDGGCGILVTRDRRALPHEAGHALVGSPLAALLEQAGHPLAARERIREEGRAEGFALGYCGE